MTVTVSTAEIASDLRCIGPTLAKPRVTAVHHHDRRDSRGEIHQRAELSPRHGIGRKRPLGKVKWPMQHSGGLADQGGQALGGSDRKIEVMGRYSATKRGRRGWPAIGVAQEFAPVFTGTKKTGPAANFAGPEAHAISSEAVSWCPWPSKVPLVRRQYAPLRWSTAPKVFTMIKMSPTIDQFSTYERSSRTASFHERSDRPLTCHKPVTPGLTSNLRSIHSRSFDFAPQWRTRANDTHFASEHVNKLWQLVDAETPQHTAYRCNPRVVSDLEKKTITFIGVPQIRQLLISIRDHGTKFQHGKRLTIESQCVPRSRRPDPYWWP